ncbi:uncharacterized protein MONBRDRAFT_31468 [Monosiga brevicollis MX1]|uniref:Uncharacterized protein n=1 Tax=Monosiga brevicollis TaxID=81824 RepID=A9UTD6_MONBE|nr:uncharacterized protein MONBRDRAFT_31468 [Monosiga brevicollis MX1]EDQ91229.1 predicted protein [Monosiga brevicollis MX1]|eukprot:XP_001743651.1 hypothetical protein [Monosiga brevicollis MX1]
MCADNETHNGVTNCYLSFATSQKDQKRACEKGQSGTGQARVNVAAISEEKSLQVLQVAKERVEFGKMASTREEEVAQVAAQLVQSILTDLTAKMSSHEAPAAATDPAATTQVRPKTAEVRALSAEMVGEALASAIEQLPILPMEDTSNMTQEQIVDAIVQTWDISEQWRYHIDKAVGDQCTVLFSIPTRRRPVPNATVEIVFNVTSVDGRWRVIWRIDDQKLEHTERTVCREEWLRKSLAHKRAMQDAISSILDPEEEVDAKAADPPSN